MSGEKDQSGQGKQIERANSDPSPRPLWMRVLDFPFQLFAAILITIYRYTFSAFAGRTCRHLPTCSEFTRDAIWQHGFWAGGWMGLARLWRCRPGGTHGYDPVPTQKPNHSSWYTPWRYGAWAHIPVEPKDTNPQTEQD